MFIYLFASDLYAQYKESKHKTISEEAIAVTKPGNYGEPGATYMLANDISSAKSAIFLGKDVTLDLNGYTITYADGNYEHIPNYGFEEGLKGWDISKAPGANVENTEEVHIFIGKKLMSLEAGDEIASQYINLPVAGRSYLAMCGVTGRYYKEMGGDISNNMKVSVYVDNELGKEVQCITRYADTTMVSCPVELRSPSFGGGFVFAHLNGLPAGKYRIRVKANTDCLIDQIDIRPTMDVGIGIVENTHPMGHYDHLFNRVHCAFFDYTEDVTQSKPLPYLPRIEGTGAISKPFPFIPVIKGAGTITIKNGIIKSGVVGIMSWGIQSTAKDVKIILDNVRIVSSGINTTAVDVPYACITNCRFDITNPFIINRHGAEFYAVDLQSEKPSEVSFSEFNGGQGCLIFRGKNSSIHHNYFVNHQTVTNHYSIMAMGDGSKIFENRIEPEIGSGIEIYVHRRIEIFNNVFKIVAEPPSCEYPLYPGHEVHCTNGIRLADYEAKPGSASACMDNKIYNNRFHIIGKKYEKYPDYIPQSAAIFYSASAGDNFIFGNEIIVEQENTDTDAEAYAFYIGEAKFGLLYDNHITTNVTSIWVASSYGSATNTKIYNNRIIKAPNTLTNFRPVMMGWSERPDCLAKNIEFRSNDIEGMEFDMDISDPHHSYSVYWTLTLNMVNKKGNTGKETEIQILDKNRIEVVNQKTDKNGFLSVELLEYTVDGKEKTFLSPYTIIFGKNKKNIQLNKNSEVKLVIK
ncbi:MAG: hypothetical protein DRI73_04325 [Bacteroidetes bacterium]|nr:MAG: hypothetical protein DRI73_04325 [Bacteroidota bacterium]